MSQATKNITDAVAHGGAAFRAAVNLALQDLASLGSGLLEPSETYPYMFWPDVTTGLLKQRNAANNAWITWGPLVNPVMLSQLLSAQGDIAYASGANTPARLPKGTPNRHLIMNGAGALPEWSDSSVVANYSHDIAVTGLQVCTGAGRKPQSIIIIGGNGVAASIGWTSIVGGRSGCLEADPGSGAGHFYFASGTGGAVIAMNLDASNLAYAIPYSFDDDGVTLDWSKSGSPTGVYGFSIIYLF